MIDGDVVVLWPDGRSRVVHDVPMGAAFICLRVGPDGYSQPRVGETLRELTPRIVRFMHGKRCAFSCSVLLFRAAPVGSDDSIIDYIAYAREAKLCSCVA